MKIRVAALSTLIALACAAPILAQVVDGPGLTATGKVVSTGNASLVVETDEQGHSIPFMVGTTTVMPPALAAGRRVTVHYHPLGTTGQIADKVVLLEAGPVSARPLGDGTNGGQSPAPALTSSPSPAGPLEDAAGTELPRTASPLPFVGLLGLVAILGSAFLLALERRRS
jgi:hypothetical protein